MLLFVFLLINSIHCIPISSSSLLSSTFNIKTRAKDISQQVIDYRRYIHQYPELGNKEHNTAIFVENELLKLNNFFITTDIAYTGITAIIEGNVDGNNNITVALRADFDGLPVKEETGLPFASNQTSSWNGVESYTMHACGHDAHTAILLGVATLLSQLKDEDLLIGRYLLIFQPAEEGTEFDQDGGAELMLEEGIFDFPFTPAVVYGLHVISDYPTGMLYIYIYI